MKAYLIWLEDFRDATDWDEIGEGDNPAQNPPPLSDGDRRVLRWCNENLSGFVKDFGLMEGLVRDLGLDKRARVLFLAKAGLIYQSAQNIAQEEAEEKAKRKWRT